MDECPDSPVEARDAAESLHFVEKSIHVVHPLLSQISKAFVTIDVFGDEGAAGRPRRQDTEVAAESAPFGEVVGDVEGARGGSGVFVVDEGDSFGGVRGCEGLREGVRVNDYVAGEEVAVAED